MSKSIDLDAIRREAEQFADLQTGSRDAVRAWQFRQLVDTTILPAAALALADEVARLWDGLSRQDNEIKQILGKAMHYHRYVDDQANFPGATEADGVCVGDHVAESLAAEAAAEIARLRAALQAVADHDWDYCSRHRNCAECLEEARDVTRVALEGGGEYSK